jgi:hypothetical protein
MQTNVIYPAGFGGTIDEFVGAEIDETEVELSSEIDLRVLWPKMIPATTPLNAMHTAFRSAVCEQFGWADHSMRLAKMPETYDWSNAYWISPRQTFRLPDELLDRL